MFIQTETTPNPSTLKFIPGVAVLENSTLQVNNKEQSSASPLAEALFDVEGVKAVFLGHDFVSVTKLETIDWEIIRADVLSVLMDHFVNNKPSVHKDHARGSETKSTSNAALPDDNPLVIQIKELIETKVRPAVAQDGGDIIFVAFENGVVKLELHGACSGCPSSTITLKNGIENMLKYYIPEIESVEAINQ